MASMEYLYCKYTKRAYVEALLNNQDLQKGKTSYQKLVKNLRNQHAQELFVPSSVHSCTCIVLVRHGQSVCFPRAYLENKYTKSKLSYHKAYVRFSTFLLLLVL